MRSIIATGCVSLLGAALSFCATWESRAQSFVSYDASLGLPEGQCWELREDLDPVVPYGYGLVGSDLHISTTNLQASGQFGGGAWVQRTDVTIDFNQPWVVEARLRIVSAPDHSVNPPTGWPRPGYTLAIYDIHGRLFWVGLGSGEVFLSNTAFGQYGTSNTVTTAFNTTDAFHTYRLTRDAASGGAVLFIDGVQQLVMLSQGPVENTGAVAYFGDPTYWANSDSYTSWFRYTGSGPTRCCDSIDFNRDGLFPDTQDIDDFLSVFSGGACSTGDCGDIDFNNDGLFPDTADIDALLSVFSGGPCT